MEPNPIWDIFIVNILPFGAFFGGVLIADRIGLYGNLTRVHMWLLSIPTGLLTTGMLITSASTTLGASTHHAYTDSVAKYAMFCAIIMFYGTAAPELYASFRARIIQHNNPGNIGDG